MLCWHRYTHLILSSSGSPGKTRIKIVPGAELPPPPPSPNSRPTSGIPDRFGLEQNFPNPFNPLTVIRYQLPVQSTVTLKIYNVLGQEVATLLEGVHGAGFLSVRWDGGNVPSGIYFAKFHAEALDHSQRFMSSRKMLLLR